VTLQDSRTFGDDLWHRPIIRIRGCDLSGDTQQTSGMSRFEAVSGKTVGSQRLWVGRTHVATQVCAIGWRGTRPL